jgi:hypothetical protein
MRDCEKVMVEKRCDFYILRKWRENGAKNGGKRTGMTFVDRKIV